MEIGFRQCAGILALSVTVACSGLLAEHILASIKCHHRLCDIHGSKYVFVTFPKFSFFTDFHLFPDQTQVIVLFMEKNQRCKLFFSCIAGGRCMQSAPPLAS